jgi:amidohydrolase
MHREPEPSGEEHQTTLRLAALLGDAGFRTTVPDSGRGLLADPPISPGAGLILLRGDIDALRISDGKSVEYKSARDGLMHACGHDAHTAVVYGALLALTALEGSDDCPWPLRYRGIFQPAEETATGAREMIEAGALEDVSLALSIHADPTREVGTIGLRDGAFTAASDGLSVCIRGRGGHAARPHESLDPIAAAAQLVGSIYLFVPRGVDTQDPVVVTIGKFHAGDNANVIPDRAELHGTIRTLDAGTRLRTRDHIRRLARGIAEVSETEIEVEFRQGPPSVVNDSAANGLLEQAAMLDPPAAKVRRIPRPSMGGEDFAFYLEQVPGAMLRLGCAPNAGKAPPLHSPLFDVDERCLAIGARILARAVVLGCRPQESTK